MDASQTSPKSQPASSTLPVRFADLQLSIGDAFSLETLSPAKRFSVKILGYMEHQSLIVSCPMAQGKPFALKEDQLVKVRLMAGKVVCGFAAKVLRVCRTPYLYMHLSYPEKIEAVEVRKASRVRVSLPVRVEEQVVGTLYGQWPKQGTVIDLSRAGCALVAPQPIAAKGDAIRLLTRFSVDGEPVSMWIPAIVRNVAEVELEPGQHQYQYGLEFQALAKEDRIWLSAFVYEQRVRQRVV